MGPRIGAGWLAIAAAWIPAACSAPPMRATLDAPEGEAAPLPVRTCGRIFLVDAYVEGRGPYTLVVDSGASSVHLDSSLGLVGPGGGRVTHLSLGPLELRNLPVLSSDLEALGRALGEPLHGILGWPAFADHLWTFDYEAGEIRVSRGRLPETGEGIFASVATSGPYLNMGLAGSTRTFLIDTGSSGGVSVNFLDEAHFEAPPVVVNAVTTADGLRLKRAGRLGQDLTLGTTVLTRPIVGFTDQISIVGARTLSHFRVTFDAAGSRLQLEPRAEGPIPSPPRRGLGLAWSNEDQGLRVIHVLPQGPGAAAGVQEGDLITTVAGRPVPRPCEPLLSAQELEGEATLTLRRGEREWSVALRPVVLVP